MSYPYLGTGTFAGFGAPAFFALSIGSGSDSDLATVCRGVYVGGAGDVKVDLYGDGNNAGGTVTFVGVQAGSVLPIVVSRVYATGSSATSMIGLY